MTNIFKLLCLIFNHEFYGDKLTALLFYEYEAKIPKLMFYPRILLESSEKYWQNPSKAIAKPHFELLKYLWVIAHYEQSKQIAQT